MPEALVISTDNISPYILDENGQIVGIDLRAFPEGDNWLASRRGATAKKKGNASSE